MPILTEAERYGRRFELRKLKWEMRPSQIEEVLEGTEVIAVEKLQPERSAEQARFELYHRNESMLLLALLRSARRGKRSFCRRSCLGWSTVTFSNGISALARCHFPVCQRH
jgi:hypothetical protein